jgi:hypothetical protein
MCDKCSVLPGFRRGGARGRTRLLAFGFVERSIDAHRAHRMTNTSTSSISRMGAKTPKPHSRVDFTVSLLERRFGVMRANVSFRNAHDV